MATNQQIEMDIDELLEQIEASNTDTDFTVLASEVRGRLDLVLEDHVKKASAEKVRVIFNEIVGDIQAVDADSEAVASLLIEATNELIKHDLDALAAEGSGHERPAQ